MSSLLANLPDLRMACVWFATVAIGTAIYFFPVARLIDSLIE